MFPAQMGYKMPAEWSKHTRTFMEWPIREALWPEPFEDILPAFAFLAYKIALYEPVTVLVRPGMVEEAASLLGSPIEILEMEHNDSWIRDNGPTFLTGPGGKVAGINWIFNGWGEKFPATEDNRVPLRLLSHLNLPCFDVPLVMEGGSIHVDGEGTLLTTEECLLNKNRNPRLNKEEIETVLKTHLNVSKIIWLKRGWYGDDTDGHIDNIAAFTEPGVVLFQTCSDPSDPNYEIARENRAILEDSTDAKGRALEILTLEQPPTMYYKDARLTLSYINFYFVNGGVILPVFGGAAADTDRAAELTFRRIFPERTISPVNGLVLARGGGNIHCLTQQMPAPIF